jgi:predicted transcriptional regulator
MRTTIELSDRTYARLRARAAERGMRGFSPLVEEALENLLDRSSDGGIDPALAAAEGAWSEADVKEWESAREEAWATWPSSRSSTPTS